MDKGLKFIHGLLIFICIATIILDAVLIGYSLTRYDMPTKVVSIEAENVVVCEDATGNLWAYENPTSTPAIGSSVILRMNNRLTKTIYDDIIESMREA